MFTLKLHHGGNLIEGKYIHYEDWEIDYIDYCHAKKFSMQELWEMFRQLDHEEDTMLLYYLEPRGDMRTGLVQLVNDKHTLEMCELVSRVRLFEVFADLKIEKEIKKIWMNDH